MLRWLRNEASIIVRLLALPLLWLLLIVALLGAVAAYQVRHSYDIDVGSKADSAVVRNFHDIGSDSATGRTFRWSDAYGYVVLPGTGGGVPFTVTLTLNTGRPNVPVTIIVNGETFLQKPFSEGWRTLSFPVDASHPQALSSRDLVVEIRTPGYPAPDLPTQIQGVMLDSLQVSASGPGFVVPSIAQLLYLALAIVLVYLFVGRIFAPLANAAGGPTRARVAIRPPMWTVPGLLAGLAVAIAFDALLAEAHLAFTSATGGLAAPVVGVIISYILMVLVEAFARRIVPGAIWGARAIAGLVGLAFMVRLVAVLLPQVNIIDLPWHMKWLRELLIGDWQALYLPGALSRVPREWGLDVLIPKSPLFYFVAAPLAVLPWNLQDSVKVFACLLDVTLMLFCYWLLARYAPALGGWRAGLWAAFAYAFNPLSFRSLAYGILPTILAQWLTVASFALLIAIASRMLTVGGLADEPPRIRGLLFLFFVTLAASLVAFPTIAVFNTMILGILCIVWLWKRLPRTRRLAWTVGGTVVAAWALALVSYYGQYVSILLTTTLPDLLNPSSASAQGTAAAATDVAPSATPSVLHWAGPLDLLGWTASYETSLIPLLAGLAGLGVLWWAKSRSKSMSPGLAALSAITGAWMVVLPVFMIINYKVDMIGKHLFFTVVPLSLGAGIFFWNLVKRGGAARLYCLLAASALAWTAIAFWVQRLVQASN
jgi:hypothetical protein